MEKKITDRFENIKDLLKDSFDLKVKDIKLSLIEFLSLMMAHFSSTILMIGLILICVLFLSLGLGLYINEIYNSNYLGFFIVAAAFVLLFIIISVIRKIRGIPYFTNTYVKLFVKIFYNESKDDQKPE